MSNDEEQRKKFAIMIADVIQELLRDSEDLSAILEKANEEGYDIFLTILSGIMIRRQEESQHEDNPLPVKFEFTKFDKEFLQSIGIRIPEEDIEKE